MIFTNHQYLKTFPINKNSTKLIVGTIHPHQHEKFLIPFFYGNVASLWNILSDAFPEILPRPITLEKIKNFLRIKKISLSDTILRCERKKLTAFDSDLIPLELNYDLIPQIKNSKINHILFTSGFGKNNAFKLFYEDILGLKITKEIKLKREIKLDPDIFDREMLLTVLISPSGASNIGLSKSPTYLLAKDNLKDSARPVYDFKVQYYREIFGPSN